jgi:uncharacterized protein YneF (UPF0154 family)
MTRKELEAMANSMDEALKRMQEQMAKLPPEQREMMEKMMPQGSSTAKVAYRKLGPGKSGAFACERYETTRDGKKVAEGCYADPKAAGIAEEDFKTLADLAKPFERIAKDFAAMLPRQGTPGAPAGAPVKTVLYQDGKAQSESLIKEIKKETLSSGLFEVPKGHTKQTLGAAGAEG